MNSFLSWIGGKRLLRAEIVKRFPPNFGRYIEVFGGAGWVLFYRDKHAEFEVYNDLNSDLVNLFRCVKNHCSEVQKELSYILNCRELFEDYLAQNTVRGLTDIQRAARFFMIIKNSYGSNCRNYGCRPKDIMGMTNYLNQVQQRLSRVVVENKPYDSLLDVYDRPAALFYLDPPYYGTEKYYSAVFQHEEHAKLREILLNIKGKFILTYNDCTQVRELYKNFNIVAVSRSNNLNIRYNYADHQYKELIIRNY
ncbi:DNA adenine methylase [Desulfotomaculum arcticum]|uniref:site-specific DNA-methyltransferase (adenine-specific) n=1 Tax=Desulfotruncus arcticus DSM 17038 TaxID=1121424 RepID=A0A1I2Y688_9FIRM|nr:DNA adenine methylase [Desulfotruncus arcticus]SFH20879.1 DNA adenine methylase [Desulfotomaculum arcticum] [Desulfotruncus arcticus DSM 17038]